MSLEKEFLTRHSRLVLKAAILFFIALALLITILDRLPATTSDESVLDSVVMLQNIEGTMFCTGVRVKVPSGNYYTLTAGHCLGLNFNKHIMSIDEKKKTAILDILKIDSQLDLMLLTSSVNKGLHIARAVKRHEKVHTVTHGARMPLYRTDGELIHESFITPMPAPKAVTTSFILPGSSGGPLLNSSNELIGIATNIDHWGVFGYFVTLEDVKKFLEGR